MLSLQEIDFIVDMVEEKLAKGGLQWLAHFQEIRRDFVVGDITFPIYAYGGLEERGFLLSRIYSSFVTPKYKVHLLVYAANGIDRRFLRKLIISCKSKFGPDDWILLALIQNGPLDRDVEDEVQTLADNRVGVVISSLASREDVYSNNVLGKSLRKNLKLTEARFEAFDSIDYLKSFAIIFALGTSFLILLQLFFTIPSVSVLTLLFMLIFSMIAGYPVYKTRFHMVLKLDNKGFEVWKGRSPKTGKWADYGDVSIYVSPNHEAFLRLHGQGKSTFDLPLSRVGVSRKDAYSSVKQFLRRK